MPSSGLSDGVDASAADDVNTNAGNNGIGHSVAVMGSAAGIG